MLHLFSIFVDAVVNEPGAVVGDIAVVVLPQAPKRCNKEADVGVFYLFLSKRAFSSPVLLSLGNCSG